MHPIIVPDDSEPIWAQYYSSRHEEQCRQGLFDYFHKEPDIFPFFRRSNWSTQRWSQATKTPYADWLDPKHSVSELIYSRMAPALRCATRMIRHHRCFFMHLLVGDIIHMNGRMRLDLYWFPKGPDEDKWRVLLETLHNISFFVGNDLRGRNAHAYWAMSTRGEWPTLRGEPKMFSFFVDFHTRFLNFFTDKWDNASEFQRNTVLTTFAVTLVHEFAHLVYMFRLYDACRLTRTDFCMINSSEPFWDSLDKGQLRKSKFPGIPSWYEGELGFSWERYAFGSQHFGWHLKSKIPGEYRAVWQSYIDSADIRALTPLMCKVFLSDTLWTNEYENRTFWGAELFTIAVTKGVGPNLLHRVILAAAQDVCMELNQRWPANAADWVQGIEHATKFPISSMPFGLQLEGTTINSNLVQMALLAQPPLPTMQELRDSRPSHEVGGPSTRQRTIHALHKGHQDTC